MKKVFVLKPVYWLCLPLVAFVTACSTNDNYLQANTLPPIVVPENLDNETLGQIYQVPEGDGRIATGELEKPLPPSLSSREEVAEPRVQTLGDQAWLVIPKEASATWSQLLLFLQSRRLSSVKQNVIDATIETNWITEAAEPQTALRYRLHLEAGLQSGLTEIHAINIQGQPNTPIDPSAPWPEKTDNVDHRVWFLKEIARVISKQKSLGDSLIASSITLTDKVTPTSVNGEPVLDLRLSQGRAYQALQSALSVGPFVVYDQSEADAVLYFDEYEKPEDEKKSLTRRTLDFLTSPLKGDDIKTSPYTVAQLLDHLPQEDEVIALLGRVGDEKKLLSRVPGYMLILQGADNRYRVYVRDGYGRSLIPSEAKQLLDTVQQQLF